MYIGKASTLANNKVNKGKFWECSLHLKLTIKI